MWWCAQPHNKQQGAIVAKTIQCYCKWTLHLNSTVLSRVITVLLS